MALSIAQAREQLRFRIDVDLKGGRLTKNMHTEYRKLLMMLDDSWAMHLERCARDHNTAIHNRIQLHEIDVQDLELELKNAREVVVDFHVKLVAANEKLEEALLPRSDYNEDQEVT